MFSACQPAELKYICFGKFIHSLTCSIALLDIVSCQIFRSNIMNIICGYNLYARFLCFLHKNGINPLLFKHQITRRVAL